MVGTAPPRLRFRAPQCGASLPGGAIAVQQREGKRYLQRPAAAWIGGRESGQLCCPLQPVPDGVGVDEDRPRAGLQVAAAVEHRPYRLQDLAARRLERDGDALVQGRARQRIAVERALGQQRVGGDRTGRLRPGPGGAHPGQGRGGGLAGATEAVDHGTGDDRPLTALVAHSFGRRRQVVLPAEHGDQLLRVHADEDLAAQRPGRPAYGGVRGVDPGRRRPHQYDHRAHRPPAQGGGAAGEFLGPFTAYQGVDHERLQPGVPRAAVLGVARVDVRRGERDLTAELHDREVQRLLVVGLGDGVDVVLDDVDGDLDQVDRLLQGDRADQLTGRGTEDLTGQPGRSAGVAAPLDERRHAGLGHERDPRPLVGGHVAEPGQLLVHAGDGLGGQRPRRTLQPPEGCLGRRAMAHPGPHDRQRVTRPAVGESEPVSLPPEGTVEVTRPGAGRAVPLAVVISCAVVVAVLGIGVRTSFAPLLRLDAAVLDALYAGDNRPKALNVLLQLLTAPGGTVVRVVLFLPVLVLLLRRRAWWTAAWVSVTILGIGPLTRLLKDFFGRVRPPYAQGGARLDSLSFPSGHSSGIATLVMVGLLLAWPLLSAHARRWAALAGAALVVLVGLTRMWLGVHYPSDVLAGWALGIAWTLFTALLFDALPGGRAALSGGGAAPPRMTGLRQHVVLAPDAGPLGPRLRTARPRPRGGPGRGAPSAGPRTPGRSGHCCESPPTGSLRAPVTGGIRTARSTWWPWS